jgi:hypothetical protein
MNEPTKNTRRLTGYVAIAHAEEHGLLLNKFNDPIEDAREGISTEEARKIALEDDRLLYLDVAVEKILLNYATDPEPQPTEWTVIDRHVYDNGDTVLTVDNGAGIMTVSLLEDGTWRNNWGSIFAEVRSNAG